MTWSRRNVLTQVACAPCAMSDALANIVSAGARRVALVIGNDRYRHNALSNAGNDARGMASLLSRAGFAVDLRLDATREQMTAAIQGLGRAVAQREVGTVLFFYAGHAAQLDWRNYLLPVDGDVQSAADVARQCVDLGLLVSLLSRTKGKTALIIIDACRDDPFGTRFRPPAKGMTPYDAPPGTLLAFATAPGRVALEVPGSTNGLYTGQLLRELAVQGVRVEDALKRVRLNVRMASGGAQVPWESTSLESDVYLFARPALSAADLEREFRDEYDDWRRIKDSTRLDDWVGYLRRYPNGKFAELAQVRIRQLLPEPSPAPAGALRLGPGLPVPARFKGSGNPNSAGSYVFRPVWTPGDTYEFEEMDIYSRVVQRRVKLVVKRVEANRVELVGGALMDALGSVLAEPPNRTFEPAMQVNPDVLQVGRKWSTRYLQSEANGAAAWGDYAFRVTGRELVKVPAGEFSAFRVDGLGSFRGGRQRVARWMLPGLNFPVRRELERTGNARVLVSARQAVSS